MDYRRLIKIEDTKGGTVGFLRVKGSTGGAEVGISIIEKLPPCRFIIFDGKNYYVISDGNFLSGVDLSYGFCLAAISDGRILAKARYGYGEFSEEGFIEFEKNCEKKEAYDKLSKGEVFYDDFKVAEENYYEKERGINEKSNNHDDFEKEDCNGGQEKGYEAAAKPYEAYPRDGEKSGYKPVIDGFDTIKDDTVLQKGEFTKGKRYEFRKLTCDKPRVYPLKVLTGTEFYKMGEDKFYLFGIFESENLPAYFVYAVPSERGKPPKGFEKAFFIPQDFFNPKVGYYCLFQKHV